MADRLERNSIWVGEMAVLLRRLVDFIQLVERRWPDEGLRNSGIFRFITQSLRLFKSHTKLDVGFDSNIFGVKMHMKFTEMLLE